MAKPGDVVEFTAGLHGIQAPRNLALLLDRRRVKGVPWVKVLTLDGEKEIKQEHLTRRAFRARYDGRLDDRTAALARLRHLAQQHAGGSLEEESEDDLGRLEQALWEATCDAGQDAWSEADLAAALYGPGPSATQLRNVREALEGCRRPGTGRFQTVRGRGDTWRPWSRSEHDALVRAWEDLQSLRRKLVATEETDEGRTFRRIALADAALGDAERATLGWVKAAMVQFVDWDGVPDSEPVAGIGGLGAVRAFGMDLHRNLGFLAQDWIGSEHTSTSSDYIHFLLEAGLWTPQDAVDGLIRRHVNQEEFFEHVPDQAAQEAALRFGDPVPEADRTDLRHIPCWTIDPPDAKDFDDAVGLEDLGAGRIRLWVHVADVSHYVTPDSALDRHAKKRATSVYLPGRVLPMLPPRLSDHLCSLRDDGDRYALSVALDVEADGRTTARAFHKALIRVTQNLSYGKALERARAGVVPFTTLLDLSKRMQGHRKGIALETGELKVLLGATGFSALEKRADDATQMIETFMVAANEAVAAHLDGLGVPQLFRCHPLPDRTKAERLRHQLRTLGLDIDLVLPGPTPSAQGQASTQSLLDQLKAGGGKLNLFGGGVGFSQPKAEPVAAPKPDEPLAPQGFAALPPAEQEAWLAPFREAVDAIAQLPDDNVADVATLKILATMSRAFYAPDNQGHFGLALTHYSHFTSPIRRYPDLVVHRNLKWHLAGGHGKPPHTAEGLRTLCDHCSNQERAADGLERRIKSSCLVLASLQGTTEGRARITGITPASVFVLRSDGIEARIPQRELPGGPYQVDEWESMLFTGEHDDPSRFADTSLKDLLEWLDPESGEVRRVRARLGQPVSVALAGRDVADGRTGARLLSWR